MRSKILIAVCIALAATASLADAASVEKARKPAWKRSVKPSPVSEWTLCRMLLADRNRLVPSRSADFFKPAQQSDVGKLMITIMGPAGGSRTAIIKFREHLRERNLKEAGRIIDRRQIIWLEPGREVLLEQLCADGIATIRPKDGFMSMHVPDWAVKRAER